MKSKLTSELNELIVKYIEAGSYAKVACQAVGIHRVTYYKWIRRGDKALELEDKGKKIPESEKKYSYFSYTIKKAEAKAIIRNILVIQTAAKKSWQAAAWWLERTHYKDYGIKRQIGGTGEEPIKIEIKNKDLEKELIDKFNVMAERYKKKKNIKKGK